jgi:YD repeat-containing protein
MRKLILLNLSLWVVTTSFCQLKAQNIFNNYNQDWLINNFFVTYPGGAGGLYTGITNDVLTVSFYTNGDVGQLKVGCYAPLNTTPILPNLYLGKLTSSLSGTPTPDAQAYHFRITNGYLCVEGTGAQIDASNSTFTVNLRDLFPTQYSYKNAVTIYGYENNIAIASVANASLNQVAYTSFESLVETPTWIYNMNNVGNIVGQARTGNKYYLFQNNVEKIQTQTLPAGRYLLTYWASNNGLGMPIVSIQNGSILRESTEEIAKATWSYYEKLIELNVSGQISLSAGRGVIIDELRLHPEKALMITQTYDIQKGVTSKTDARNISEFYEYDDFGRLIYVRDEHGNIIKQHHYYLKPQN